MKKDEKMTSFEEALSRLETVVRKLEDGRLSLEESLELFAEGVELSKVCSKHLEDAEQRISVLVADANGGIDLKDIKSFPASEEGAGSEF